MNLALVIQTHFMSEQIEYQAKAFVSRGHRVLISIDSAEAFASAQEIFKETPKVDIVRSMPVIWCGMSQVDMYVDCLRRLLAYDDWHNVINISGSCILTRPIAELERHLVEADSEGIDAFMWYFRSSPDMTEIYSDECIGGPWITLANYYSRNMNIIIPTQTKGEWENPHLSPISRSERRFAFRAMDDINSKSLIIRPLMRHELAARVEYIKNNGLYIGRSWYVFNRSAVKFLLTRGVSSLTWQIFKDAFEPDEYIIHNVIINEGGHLNVKNSNLQFDFGRVSDTSIEDLDEILRRTIEDKNAFFVRKIKSDIIRVRAMNNNIWLRDV